MCTFALEKQSIISKLDLAEQVGKARAQGHLPLSSLPPPMCIYITCTVLKQLIKVLTYANMQYLDINFKVFPGLSPHLHTEERSSQSSPVSPRRRACPCLTRVFDLTAASIEIYPPPSVTFQRYCCQGRKRRSKIEKKLQKAGNEREDGQEWRRSVTY